MIKLQTAEILRYFTNGLLATMIHFGVLTLNLGPFAFKSAGLANFVAAIFGIAASFLGSRYYVFTRAKEGFVSQALKFSGLYATIAVLHGLFLFAWSDWHGLDYRAGFFFATVIQFALSYLGNKFLVFKI
jgi:putative flippase GtrA